MAITIPAAPQPGASEAERQAFDDACRVAALALQAAAIEQAAAAQATREAHAQAQADTVEGQ